MRHNSLYKEADFHSEICLLLHYTSYNILGRSKHLSSMRRRKILREEKFNGRKIISYPTKKNALGRKSEVKGSASKMTAKQVKSHKQVRSLSATCNHSKQIVQAIEHEIGCNVRARQALMFPPLPIQAEKVNKFYTIFCAMQ